MILHNIPLFLAVDSAPKTGSIRVPPLDESNLALTGGLACLAVIVVLLVMTPVIIVLERRRLRRATARFLRGREALSDKAFLNRAGATPEAAGFFLAARRAMAKLSGVPPEMVHPEDTWRSLMDLQWDNGFMEDIIFGLEEELGVRLPLLTPADDRLSVADYVRRLAELMRTEKEQKGSGVD